jgi:hypothetical protein
MAAPPQLLRRPVVQPASAAIRTSSGSTAPAGSPHLSAENHLVFLPAFDATRTRRAHKASSLMAVVVRSSMTRKRYERQGLLVEPAALDVDAESGTGDR